MRLERKHRSTSEPSSIPPLPYFPNLRWALANNGAALVLVYLELYFPAPQDPKSLPPVVSLARLRRDLRMYDRTLRRYLSCIATRYESPAARRAAVMCGREFIRVDRRYGLGAIKCYSLTFAGSGLYTLRRNDLRLQSVLQAAGCVSALAQWLTKISGHEPIQPVGYDDDAIDRPPESRDRIAVFCAQIDDAIARRPEVVAAAVARSLNQISGFGDGRRIVKATDGRRRKGIKRQPWTAERRARFMTTMERKWGKNSV